MLNKVNVPHAKLYKCTGLTELQRLNKTLFYLLSIAASLLNPFEALRFLEHSNRTVFINKTITYKSI